MYTALVSPDYAERFGQAVTVAGGFIAHGLISPYREETPGNGWFFALLPGQPESADQASVQPLPASQVERILQEEKQRYLELSRDENDPVWDDAASVVTDMLHCLRRAEITGPNAGVQPREHAAGS